MFFLSSPPKIVDAFGDGQLEERNEIRTNGKEEEEEEEPEDGFLSSTLFYFPGTRLSLLDVKNKKQKKLSTSLHTDKKKERPSFKLTRKMVIR